MSDEQKKTEEIKKQNEHLENQLKMLKQRTAEAEKSLKQMQDGAALALKQNDAQSHALETERALITLNEKKIAADEKELERLEYRKKMGLELSDSEKKSLKNLGKSIEARQQENKELADSNKRKAVGHDIAKGIASTMLGINKNWKSTWWGQLSSGGGFSEKIAQLGKSFGEAINPADMLGSTIMKIQISTAAAVLSFDSSTASLAAATGQGTKYNDMIMDISDSNRSFGVGIAESAEAIQGLNDTMSDFVNLSDEVAGAMAAQAAQLSKLGVAATTTGKLNNQFMKGMGMTADQAMAVNNDLARTAMGIGIAPAKMAADFEAALPKLAAWGKDAPKIFKKVAAAAKGLGVEMNTLLGFASQFDTFEGSATAVGKLNNILGGDLLNSYDMLNASEEQRIRMLLQSVDASGKSWESMGRFERRAVASAAGITDMAEANNLFAGGLSAYDDAQKKAQANAVSQKELEERTAAAVKVSDKFYQILEAMAIAVAPIVNVLHSLTNAVLAVNDATGGMLVPVILGAIAVYAVFYNLQKMGIVLTKGSTLAKLANVAVTKASTIAEGASATVKGLLAAASSALGIGLKAQAVGQSSVGKTAPIATAGVSTFFGALTTFAATGVGALVIGAVVLLAISLAVAAVAAAAMVYSIVSLVKAFMQMPEAILPALAGLAGFMTILYIFIVATAALAPIAAAFAVAGAFIGAGLMAMAPGLIYFSAGLAIFGLAMKLFGGGTLVMMLLVGLALGKFASLMFAAAPKMFAAAIPMTAALVLLGVGFAVFSVGMMMMMGAILPMLLLPLVLMGFANALFAAAPILSAAAITLAPALALLGPGFASLALGLILLTFAIPAMFLAALALPLFAFGLFKAAPMMAAAAGFFAPAAKKIAFALGYLGLALLLFDTDTMIVMSAMVVALPLFALGLMLGSGLMKLAAKEMKSGVMLIAVGLGLFGLALKLFDKKTIDIMTHLVYALPVFALGLLAGAAIMKIAGKVITPAALWLALGLAALGIALMFYDRKTIKTMEGLVIALPLFALALMAAGYVIAAASLVFTPAVGWLAVGLFGLAVALMPYGEGTISTMWRLGYALPALALGIGYFTEILDKKNFSPTSFIKNAAAIALGIGLIGLGASLMPDATAIATTAAGLVIFAIAVAAAGALFTLWKPAIAAFIGVAPLLGIALAVLGFGMSMASAPIKEFAEAIAIMAPFAGSLFELALGLAAMGPALAIFAFSMIAVGIAASMPFFSTGIGVFKDAISSMATSFEAIPTEKAQALGDFFSSLAKLTELNNVAEVMWAIAGGIYGVSAALAFMPEEKAFALSEVVNSVTRAAVEVTPEKVENVTGLVEQAAAYADVQAKFKAPSVDAFVQALKQVSGDSGSGSGSSSGRGKDIVLELNGREIGRAIDVHLDDKHNLRSN